MSLQAAPFDGRQFLQNVLEIAGIAPGDRDDFFARQQEEMARHRERVQQNEDAFERRQEANERMIEQRQMREEAAENRPAEDRLNIQIAGMPLAFGGALFNMEAFGEIIDHVGEMLSPRAMALGDQMMVTSNGFGEMLAQVREAFGIEGPAADTRMTGPEQAVAFKPGVQPAPAAVPGTAPGVAAPGSPLDAAPGMDRAPKPPGMGVA